MNEWTISPSVSMNEWTISPSVLTIFVLGTCLTCIYMVFFFGRRLQSTAYLRDSLIEGAKQQELKVLLRELHDKACAGPLDPRSPPPERYGSTRRLWEPDRYVGMESSGSGYVRLSETDQEREARLKEEEEERQRAIAVRQWESDEKIRCEALQQQAEKRALELAEKKIPNSIDISLLGGWMGFPFGIQHCHCHNLYIDDLRYTRHARR
jgi:hypothetical protein